MKTQGESNVAIWAALLANLGIAIAKFVAAAITGSSSMQTEGVHSLVDCTNEVLLMFGKRQARKPADEARPFGYGREEFFWAFIVSIMVFAVGAGVSLYEGIQHVIRPEEATSPTVAFIVLGIAFVLEAGSLVVGAKQFAAEKGKLGWIEGIKQSKDPSLVAVVLEDSAAVLGVIVAAAALGMSVLTGDGRWDGVGSIVIGLILVSTSYLLGTETKGLLMGERADPALEAGIKAVVTADATVTSVDRLRTVVAGRNHVVAMAAVNFRDDITAEELERTVGALKDRIRQQWPSVKEIYLSPDNRV